MRLAVDLSNYSGIPTAETFKVWEEAGVRRAIIRASTERQALSDIARQQLQACQDAGLELYAYLWCYWSEALDSQVQSAEQILSGFPVKALALDCEDAVIWDAETMVSKIREGVSACTLPCMIYTSRYWWTRNTGDSIEFSHLPLWDCDLGEQDINNFLPYGGWQSRVMLQYQFDADLGGCKVDLNVYGG